MTSSTVTESRGESVAAGGASLNRDGRKESTAELERRLALIHRVIVPDEECPKEYAILVTDRRSIFVRLEKTRSRFVLRGEMRFGTALVTDVKPKTLEDYQNISLESLTADGANFVVPHEALVSLAMRWEEPGFRLREVFVWLTMRRQQELFQVYHLEMRHRRESGLEMAKKLYLVPLGAYFKPRRQTKSRETILHEYA